MLMSIVAFLLTSPRYLSAPRSWVESMPLWALGRVPAPATHCRVAVLLIIVSRGIFLEDVGRYREERLAPTGIRGAPLLVGTASGRARRGDDYARPLRVRDGGAPEAPPAARLLAACSARRFYVLSPRRMDRGGENSERVRE